MVNPNVLSQRYATPVMNKIWSEEGKILAERDLWIAVMKAQRELGVDIPAEDIEKFERAREDINLARIKEIERRTRHDVKARIEAYVEAAGAGEHVHKGMTSRDLTDNVEQMQVKQSAKVLLGKYVSVLRHFLDKAQEYAPIVLTARTHHQAAQPTLLGRRMAMWAEELLLQLPELESFIERYPLRGIKGPVGTQSDMIRLLGCQEKVDILENKVAEVLGFTTTLQAPGQVYFRSLDFKYTSRLVALSSALENFALGMRLMAGYDLVTEGFREGQVGSSAMPHKMNTRTSERIYGLGRLIKMHSFGASLLSGDTWEEGDVSCSVPRRVILPDISYAADGQCEAALTVLNEMGHYEKVIAAEVDRYMPFLATTAFLTVAMNQRMGREDAHKVIKKYSVAQALLMREGRVPDVIGALVADPECQQYGIDRSDLENALREARSTVGNADQQIKTVVQNAAPLLTKYSQEAAYEPGDIL